MAGSPTKPLKHALERLDELVDWERRDRSGGAARQMRVDLGPIRDLVERLGHPERAYRTVHLAGSKGKGSTAALIASGLQNSGVRVGLYTSPHVERVQERILLQGQLVEDNLLAEALDQCLAALEQSRRAASPGQHATWFDLLTAAAFVAFREAKMQWAVVECGLGGRLDSTNVVQPALTVLTGVTLEHCAILGDTRALIASEKSGILKPGVPLVSAVGDLQDEAGRVVADRARELGLPWRDVPAARRGQIAERNRALAEAALEVLEVSNEGSLGGWQLPGRLEIMALDDYLVVLDGAHTPESLELVLTELVARGELAGPPVVIFGCGKDKAAGELLKLVGARADRVLCTVAGKGPYRDPRELLALAREQNLEAEVFSDPRAALLRAREVVPRGGWILVTGSLHLVGALRGLAQEPTC